MKTNKVGIFAVAGAVALLTSASVSSAATDDASDISAFAGKYRGTATLTQTSVPGGSGTTVASFRASNKKETGNLLLSSVFVVGGGTAVPVQENYNFRGRSLIYTLSASGTSLSGFGRSNVSKRKITYLATISTGTSSATVSGIMRRTAKRLLITEQLNTGFSTATFVYNLKRRGKR